jgi:hypothetical protein
MAQGRQPTPSEVPRYLHSAVKDADDHNLLARLPVNDPVRACGQTEVASADTIDRPSHLRPV